MYWNAADEGAVVQGSNPERRLDLAKELNAVRAKTLLSSSKNNWNIF
jgi:hypothetical protein